MAQFQPGQSGNPSGRPKKAIEEKYLKSFYSVMKQDDWKEIVEKAIAQAKRGDHQARKWLSDYALGTPIQRIEHTGNEGGAIVTQVITGVSYADLQPDREQ